MATKNEYKDFILEQLNLLKHITYRPMMGEYLLYYNGTLFGGIYDNRLLIKIGKNNQKYSLKEVIPYKGAKPMYEIKDIEDKELTKEIILTTYQDLSMKTNK